MTPSPELHTLIHSPSKSEKIRIKDALKRSSLYAQLFSIIQRQLVYDEDAIKNRFSRQSRIKQLPVAKNYLFKFILAQLLQKYEENNLEMNLARKFHFAECNVLK